MYAPQLNYDMAEPEHDYAREEAEERIAELLDSGDEEAAKAFAEYAYETIAHDEIVAAMAALFSVTDSQWRAIRGRLPDSLGGPLGCLRLGMEASREAFITEQVEQQLEGGAA